MMVRLEVTGIVVAVCCFLYGDPLREQVGKSTMENYATLMFTQAVQDLQKVDGTKVKCVYCII